MRSCYICKVRYDSLHHFYCSLCPTCASLNYAKRFQTTDFGQQPQLALVTGCRVKIGFHVAVKLLMAGATVLGTTRFPRDALRRFEAHPGYPKFHTRLHLFGLDFRDIVALEDFVDYILGEFGTVDIVIHNACQTIRRPPAYYRHLIEYEVEKTQMQVEHEEEDSSSLVMVRHVFM